MCTAHKRFDDRWGARSGFDTTSRIHIAKAIIVRDFSLRAAGSSVDANSMGVRTRAAAGLTADIGQRCRSHGEMHARPLNLKAITPNRRDAGSASTAPRRHEVSVPGGVRVIEHREPPSHISTGLLINKSACVYNGEQPYADEGQRVSAFRHSRPLCLNCQCEPMQRAAATVVRLAQELRDSGIQLDHIDVGGGLGISYDGSRVPTAAEYAAAVLSIVKPSGLAIALEPGRYLVGAAGALLARVIDLKDAPGAHHFAVLDAGMTELMRPALYGSFHRIEAVTPSRARELSYDIVGPVCEAPTRSRMIAGCRHSRWHLRPFRCGRVGSAMHLSTTAAAAGEF